MKFFWTVFPALVFIAALLTHTFVHDATGRSQEPASMFNIDILSSLLGLLGLFILSALYAVHRRVAALEKRAGTDQQNQP